MIRTVVATVHWTAASFLIVMIGTPITFPAYLLLAALTVLADQMVTWPLRTLRAGPSAAAVRAPLKAVADRRRKARR